MDPGNSVMRRTCLQSSMTVLKEIARVFPMVALNDTSTKLAVGDAIGEIKNASIQVYDMQRYKKVSFRIWVVSNAKLLNCFNCPACLRLPFGIMKDVTIA